MDVRPHPPPGAGRVDAGVLALGVDVGTTNVKVALVAIAGDSSTGDPAHGVRVLGSAAAPTPGDADALVAAVARLVRSVCADAPRPPAAVGIASMAETGVPLDATGRPLRPLLRWDGRRGAAAADALGATLGRDTHFAATGVRVSPKVPLATWAWLRREDPATAGAMDRWAGAADLVCRAVTGRLATDHTLAGRTGAYRLPAPGEPPPAGFEPDLLAAVGLRPEQLPDVVGPDEVAGRVREGAFIDAGLPPGTPVVVAGHDHAVGAYAAGVRAPGDVADSVGTAEAVVTVLDRRPDPAAVAAAGMSLTRTVAGRHDALVAGSPAAGAMVAWWLAAVAGGRPAAEVFAAVDDVPAAPTGVLVLPYPAGRQAPAPDPRATVRVLGATGAHGPGHLARALLEGLCLQARWLLVEQSRLGGSQLRRAEVAVLGGAVTANRHWLAVKAAATPARLRLVRAGEPVAAGAALVAAERAGLLPAGAGTPLLGSEPVASDGAADDPAYDPMYAPMYDPEYDPVYAAFVTAALAPPAEPPRTEQPRTEQPRTEQSRTRHTAAPARQERPPMATPDPRPSLAALARPSGALAMVAMDQRESLRAMVAEVRGDRPGDEELVRFKLAVAEVLGPLASGFLIDRELGFEAVRSRGLLPPSCGLLLAADALQQEPGGPVEDTELDEAVLAPDVDLTGVAGLKLLVIWRRDARRAHRVELARRFVAAARDRGLLSVLEPVVRPTPAELAAGGWDADEAIAEAAKELSDVGADLYKAQVPCAGRGPDRELRAACERLGAAVSGPWVVLSQGVDRADFLGAVTAACQGGASGFLAGRALWSDVVGAADVPARLRQVSAPRLERLAEVVDRHARPWSAA